MAKEEDELITFGHSGGAVPELHRSSLFVGQANRNACADHQRTDLTVADTNALACRRKPRREWAPPAAGSRPAATVLNLRLRACVFAGLAKAFFSVCARCADQHTADWQIAAARSFAADWVSVEESILHVPSDKGNGLA